MRKCLYCVSCRDQCLPGGKTATAATSTLAATYASPPQPPSKLIELQCAKAGPHWNAQLPKHTTVAVELLPESDDDDDGATAAFASVMPSPRRLEPFALHDIELLGRTHVARATATNRRYLLSLSTDSLLFAWRKNAGLSQPSGAVPPRGCDPMGSS